VALNRGTLILFFFMKNTLKCNKNNRIFHNFQYFLTLKYKYTIMCNYLNNCNNFNGCSLHSRCTFKWKIYQKMNSLFVWQVFKAVHRKMSHKIYVTRIILHPLSALFGLQFMLPMEKSVTFTGACANEIIPNG
jgi:hypothetical protein